MKKKEGTPDLRPKLVTDAIKNVAVLLKEKGYGPDKAVIEEVVNRVDARLTDAETRTEETLAALSGAFAALAMGLNGALTALLLPLLVGWMH